jgi:hypothetical protein
LLRKATSGKPAGRLSLSQPRTKIIQADAKWAERSFLILIVNLSAFLPGGRDLGVTMEGIKFTVISKEYF